MMDRVLECFGTLNAFINRRTTVRLRCDGTYEYRTPSSWCFIPFLAFPLVIVAATHNSFVLIASSVVGFLSSHRAVATTVVLQTPCGTAVIVLLKDGSHTRTIDSRSARYLYQHFSQR